MAKRIQIPFVGPTARDRSVAVNDQVTVNFMQAIKGRGAKAPVVLETGPGIVVNADAGDGPIRTNQMVNSKVSGAEVLYGVYGSKLVAQTTTSGNQNVGTLNTLTGRVEIARGRNYIMLVDGQYGYYYDGTTFAQIVDLDFPANPTHVRYIDGFFIVNDAATDNFYISPLEDPSGDWNALDFEAASVAPDNALAIAATESLLWIIGDETAQAYYNTGNADFPYTVLLSATQEVGILAPHSLAESDDGIFYLATTPEGGRFVYLIQGTAGQVITGDEEEAMLTTVIDPTDAYAFIYKQAGKSFYVLQLSGTSGNDSRSSLTMVYNIKARSWETREMQDGSAWRVGGHGILNNRNIVGSRLQGSQMELSLTNYQDAGQEMIRRRRTQIMHTLDYQMDWEELIIDVEVGVGSAVDADPLIRVRYTDMDNEWSDYLDGYLGGTGNKTQRIVFHQLGQSRKREWELLTSANAPETNIAANARVAILQD
jgi:hypothetical protein